MNVPQPFRTPSLLCLLLACTLAGQAQPWTFTGPGNWDDPSKWSPSYPGLNIGFSEVTLNGDCNLGSNTLNLSGGYIYSNGNFTSSGDGVLNLSGGNFYNNGSMTHNGTGGLTLSMSSGVFTNNGTLTFTADFSSIGGLCYNSGSLVVNATVNSLILTNNTTGTVTGTGSLSFGNLNNSGSIGSPSLTLVLNNGAGFTNSGGFHVYQNATLGGSFQNNGGTLTIHPGVTLNMTNGTNFHLHLGGVVHINGIVNLSGGYPNLNFGTISVGSGGELRINDAAFLTLLADVTLNNSGTVTSTSGTGTLNIHSGTFNNTGSLAHNSAALTLSFNSGTLNNNTGGVVDLYTSLTVPATATISNAATLNLHNAASLIVPVNAVLANTGTIGAAPGQTGTLNIQSGGTLNNAGTIEHGGATALTVQLDGTFNNQSGGVLRLVQNAFFSAGTFHNNAGASIDLNFKELWLMGSHVFNHSGTFTGIGNFVVSGGTFNNSTGFTHNSSTSLFLYSNGKVNILSGGSLVFNSSFTVVDGIINNSGGTMTINAAFVTPDSLINGAGGTLNLNSSLQLNTAAAVLNLGGTFTPNNAFLGINQATLNLGVNMTVSLTGGGSVVDLDFPQGTINVQNAATLTFDEDFLFGIQVVNVQAGGTLVIPTGKSLTLINTSVLNNSATLTLGGTLTIGAFNSLVLGGTSVTNVAGTLNLNAGILGPASGATVAVSSGGAFRVNDGAVFALGSGVVFNNAGTVSTTSGAGTFTMDGGTFNNTGSLTHDSQLTLALIGGTLNNNSGGALGFSKNFTYDSGTINNNSGGQLTISQSFTIAAGRTLTSAGTLTNSGSITNNGTLLQTDGEVNNNGDLSGSGALTVNGGTFQNANNISGQAITVAGATSILNNNSGGLLIFSVNSTISGGGIFENKTGGTFHIVNCTVQVSSGSTLTHRGAIACNNGTLDLHGVLNNYAPDLRQQSGVLNIAGISASTFNNYGTFSIYNVYWATYSTVNNYAGAIFSIEYGTAFLRAPAVNEGTFVSTTGGRIELDANFLNSGTIANCGFRLGQFYTFTNTGTCTFVDQLDFFSNFENVIVNSGTLTLNGSFSPITPGSGHTVITNTGTINTNGNFTSNFQLNITNSNIFNQNGFLTFFHGNSSFQVDGTLNIAAGKALHIECPLKGSGTINNVGQLYTPTGCTLRPGASPGTLTVSHDYDLTAAVYHCEINGTTPGTQHDVIAVAGAVTLTSASLVVDWGSFTPTAGQTFDIMTFTSRTGTFANVTIPPVSGLQFTVGYTATKVTLNAQLLPVELVEFKAKPIENKVLLQWSTASELNADRFDVERSTDGFFFEKIGEKQAAGTTTAQQSYVFLDVTPLPSPLEGGRGVIYYRLRQVDFDGSEELSKVVVVDLRSLQDLPNFTLFPNPSAGSELNIRFMGEQFELGSYEVFDAMGRLVRQGLLEDTGGGEFQVKMDGHLPAGSYFIQLKDKALRSFATQRFEVVN